VQSCAHQAWNQPEGNFHDLISQDARVTQQLSSGEIEACFDPQHPSEAFRPDLPAARHLAVAR